MIGGNNMKILILGGFLGSGKTSTLMRLARYLVEKSSSGKDLSVMILENEVGEVGIDDTYLRSGGLKVDNLFSGCACCSFAGELTYAVSKIEKEYDPDWLIIETTGVAYPSNMRKNLKEHLNLDTRIVIIADAARWNRILIPLNNLIVGQLEGADVVLINKTDLVDEATLDKVEKDILGFEPQTTVFRVSALQDIPAEIWDKVIGEEAVVNV